MTSETDDESLEAVELPKRAREFDAKLAKKVIGDELRLMGHRHGHRTGLGRFGESPMQRVAGSRR